jgi:transcriptional regulator with GAF, ATPase, and Fis domain
LAPALDAALTRLQQVARSPISILIQGDSGTGKEVTARAAHALSGREGEFVAVNCGAIPANLVESELFGYRKGAFSGAVEDRPGLVRSAHRGTLFLDEIGDLPTASQAALLRVLQEREVTPVGGVTPVHVDLRVIAATNRDIDGMVASEDFRRDLFARLAGFRIELPPLNRRLEDFGLLVGTLTDRVVPNAEEHPGFECDAIRQMLRYSWPLNIRELEQCIRTASVLAGENAIAAEHLPESVRNPAAPPTPTPSPASPPALTPEDEKIRDDLLDKLRETSGNISAVARAMGKDRKQIQRWLKRFQIDASDFR